MNWQLLINQSESLSNQNYATKAKKQKSQHEHEQHEPTLTHDSVAS